jgi:cytochrome P450
MTLYNLTQHPEMLQKLKQEIHDIYNKESPISIDCLNKMNWLTGCLKETLRLYHPTGIGPGFKEASQDHKIGDIEIQKGTRVVASLVHSDFSQVYFDDPMNFQPQRWIDKPSLSESYAFTPFWAGPRNCIGQHMAMIEAKIMMCEFINRFDFEMVKDYKLKMSTTKGYGPENDLPMNLTVRKEIL